MKGVGACRPPRILKQPRDKHAMSEVNEGAQSCADGSCYDVKLCLEVQMDLLCPDGSDAFDINSYNCRHFVAEAMGNCCLTRGGLFDVDVLAPFRYRCSACARHETRANP